LHQVVRFPALARGLVGELRFEFRREIHFHSILRVSLSE
jgi:hypothetical protein